jgi:tetratricopeptide (TPR) repeat protein
LEESKRDPASELEILKDSLAGRLQKGKTAPLTIKSRNGEISAVEITGELGENAYVIRGTVLVVDEIAAQLWLECQSSQREATRRDWEQLVGSFHLQAQTKPEHALAFPLRKSFRERAPDPGLAAFLTRATAVIPEPRQHQVRAISADGTRALVQAPEGLVLETIATHKREPLTLKLMYGQPVAVSANGRKVAVATEGEINVVNLDTKFSKRIPVSVSQLTFGPAGDDLIICAHDAPEPGVLEMFRFQTSRLERIKFAGGKSEILVEFPLSRVAHPTVSPDGKWIALVSNRDYPRSVPFGGHLYLLAVDGSHFRQLTKDPEEITSLAWSGDGKWIFAVRRLAVGEKGAVGIGGSPDLYRISPETGEGINLTRSGHIGRVWSSGLDLLLECNAWEVPPSQRGIFRISATELEKATSSRPVPPMADPRRQGRVVGEKVRESLGGDRIKDVVPTPALMAKAAEAFVQGVAQACACPLDFSAASLDRLPSLAEALDLSYGREPAMVLGFGAYYGETLRRVAGAEWELKPVPFGEWIPGRRVAGNPLVEIVMPFSESYRWALHSEEEPVRRSEEILNRIQGQKIILVYPPSHVEETLANKTPENYYKALRMLDAGNVKEGLDHLTVEMQRSPKNGPLAREVIAVCEGARLQEVAKTLTRKAVEAGNEVSELLVRYADDLAPVNPEKALRYYQKAVQGDWVPAEAYFKLGHHYKSMGQTAIAESCWRRAYLSGTLLQRKQIRQLLDIDEPEENEDIPP